MTTMMLQFERPVGALTDVAGLEYISALMQTERLFLRQDGSLTASDIHLFLKSRHGVDVPKEQIEQEILLELGGSTKGSGGSSSNDEKKKQEEEAQDDKDKDDHDMDDVEEQRQENNNNNNAITQRGNLERGEGSRHVPQMKRQRASLRLSMLRFSERIRDKDLQKLQEYEYEAIGQDVDNINIETKLDLAQIASLLLLPKLRQIRHASDHTSANSNSNGTNGNTSPTLLLIEQVLTIILRETHLEKGQEITRPVLDHILSAFLLQQTMPDDALDEMMTTATNVTPHPRLDAPTLLRILTDDIDAYDVEWDGNCANVKETTVAEAASSRSAPIQRPLQRIYTATNIDSNIDAYKSNTWQFLAWYTMVMTAIAYYFDPQGSPVYVLTPKITTCVIGVDVGCALATAILQWIELLLRLSLFGVPFLWLATLGNSVYVVNNDNGNGNNNNWIVPFSLTGISMTCVAIYVTVPYLYQADYGLFRTDTTTAAATMAPTTEATATPMTTTTAPTTTTAQNNREQFGPVALGFGVILMCQQLYQMLLLLVPALLGRQQPREEESQSRSSSNNNSSNSSSRALMFAKYMKQAADYKVQQMIQNALSCHEDLVVGVPSSDTTAAADNNNMMSNDKQKKKKQRSQQQHPQSANTHYKHHNHHHNTTNSPIAQAIVQFQQQTGITEPETIGGIRWTWRKVMDGTLFYQEGVWLFSRLFIANSAQWCVVILVLLVYIYGCILLSDNEVQQLPSVATNRELLISLSIGFIPALISSVTISLLYIPSGVSTLLTFRCGVRGSLRERTFSKNRSSMDTTNLLFGAAFWSCLGSSMLYFILFGGFVVLCFYSVTRQVMVTIVANFFGMLTTLIVKWILMRFIRSAWHRGYYRSRPAVVNVSNTIQEVWNLGLTVFVTSSRVLKLFCVLLFYIGRIDIHIFAPGIGWLFGMMPLDSLPYSFRRDLLQHDAHRHPLIERLGLLYMLKLRHGSSFGTRGGAQWRILFTCCLMPWLQKYRRSLGICGHKPTTAATKSEGDKNNKQPGGPTNKKKVELTREALVEKFTIMEQKCLRLQECFWSW